LEYAKFLGMDLDNEKDLFWIAREGLKTPLQDPWKPCKTKDGNVFYFNFETKESQWEHPCDEYCKKQYEKEKSKKEGIISALKDEKKEEFKGRKEKLIKEFEEAKMKLEIEHKKALEALEKEYQDLIKADEDKLGEEDKKPNETEISKEKAGNTEQVEKDVETTFEQSTEGL